MVLSADGMGKLFRKGEMGYKSKYDRVIKQQGKCRKEVSAAPLNRMKSTRNCNKTNLADYKGKKENVARGTKWQEQRTGRHRLKLNGHINQSTIVRRGNTEGMHYLNIMIFSR